MVEPIITVKDLKKYYPIKKQDSLFKYDYLRAIDGISFKLYEGETLGLVGESGCGKSTTRKLLLNVEPPTQGEVLFNEKNIFTMNNHHIKDYRRNVQMVFQDPYASLDPKWKVINLISESLRIHKIGSKKEQTVKVLELMKLVGLKEEHCHRYPHEFSGGQRQRICIARALALDPKVIVADEPVSALDVSIQAQVLNLFKDLKEKLNLTYLFISHDLNVIKYISNRVAVMYLGRIVEIADTQKLFNNPRHPYTEALMNAIPVPDPRECMEMRVLGGEVPSPINPPDGCTFHPRCPNVMEICKTIIPSLTVINKNHQVACHLTKC
ncbi:MAG: hypothetical protein APF76_15120 [Desulfitibacter sp. BRH_c19]|nr:MAG: hypothetical protein APF76_15120 [Desulfitibacter sp. BRH_c19]